MLVSRFASGLSVLFIGCASVFGQGFDLPANLPPGAVEAVMGKAMSGQPPLIAIAAQKPVQTELKIEASQKQRIDAIVTRLKGVAMANLAAGADKAKLLAEFAAETTATNKELESILSADQMVRLKQVALQLQGPQAILAPEFAEELELTSEQIEKIKRMPRRDDKALAAILDKDQRKVWHEKIGKPFKGKMPTLPAGIPIPQN